MKPKKQLRKNKQAEGRRRDIQYPEPIKKGRLPRRWDLATRLEHRRIKGKRK